MKLKHALSLLSLATCAAISTSALAQTGTITVNGKVIADTCTVNITGQGSSVTGGFPNYTITLPDVSSASLSSAGATAGDTEFSVELSGCTLSAGTTRMWAFFSGGNVNSSTGRLNNTGGTLDVSFQLTNGLGGAAIQAGGSAAGAPGSNQGTSVAFQSGSASKKYAVRYYANSALPSGAAGNVSSSVTYNIQYH